MKRLLTLAATFLCCVATTFAQFSGSGSGTESDPYLILNPIQLNQLRNFLNTEGVYFKLMANIDLTEFLEEESPTQGWQPVGTSSTPFKGVLDGNGKTISGFWIDRSNTNYVGLFGNLSGGTVKNLSLNGSFVKGKDYVGFLSGIGGNIDNCSFIGSVSGISYVGGCTGSDGFFTTIYSSIDVDGSGDYVGGVSGQNGTFQDCKVSNTLIRGNNYVGGVCGANKMDGNTIYNCIIETTIIATNCVGGISGEIVSTSGPHGGEKIEIRNCGFVGNVSATSMVGGIVGRYKNAYWATQKILENNYAIGTLSATGDCVGGIVGYTEPAWANPYASGVNIRSSYFSGNVSGNQNVGGLVGQLYSGSIKSSYSASSIVGNNNVGGICGSIKGYSSNAYAVLESNFAIALSIKANEGDVGRIYGKKDNYVYIGEMGTSKDNKVLNRCIVIEAGVAKDIIDNEQNGTGISNTTLKLKATYVAVGWDFTNTWEIQETECYPYMKSQTAPPVIQSAVVSGATTISGKCVDGGTVTLEIDGVKQQMVSSNHEFSFTVSPLQAGHEVRVSAKADGKEQSYFTTAVVSFLGKGTEADPYQVYTAADLTQVYRKGYFKLMNDIDLTSYINQFSPTQGWESIGRDGSETIHFDGNGHKITGLWCNSTRDNTGLFSCFANGEIKNLTVETAKNKQVKGGKNTGIIIGKMINGTIENCVVSGSVADGTPVGGIVGLMDNGNISKCQANVNINTTGATSYVGGIVGEITGGEIDQCFTQGTLTATGSESYAAGLVGKNSATVKNCYSNATITSSYNAAGIVAYNYGVVDKCYATGNLFSSNYAAGIIGYNDGANAVVKNCVAMNNKIDVTYESQQQQQGGGYGQRIIGGIRNGALAPELNNYALKTMQVSVNNVAQKVYDDIMNGVGKNGSDLLKASTYKELGWDFTNTWTIKEDENYPSLKNNVGTVVKPGEDPNTEPEPTETDDDKIVVAGVSATKGQQVAFSIDLENKTTDLTAYQFDLTLPDGISLSVNDKGK